MGNNLPTKWLGHFLARIYEDKIVEKFWDGKF